MTDSVFVSYSRSDWRMATRVVQLLRARDDVFYDIDSIPAGEPWRDVLVRAIDDASQFYLLWCKHSAGSEEVEREWQRAISGSKRLVPVLLDSTPLIEPLTKYQYVDFRGVLQGHDHRFRPFGVLAVVVSVFVALAAVLIVPQDIDLPGVVPGVPSIRPVAWLALSVLAVVTLVALITRRYRRRRRTRQATEQLAEAIANDLASHTS